MHLQLREVVSQHLRISIVAISVCAPSRLRAHLPNALHLSCLAWSEVLSLGLTRTWSNFIFILSVYAFLKVSDPLVDLGLCRQEALAHVLANV